MPSGVYSGKRALHEAVVTPRSERTGLVFKVELRVPRQPRVIAVAVQQTLMWRLTLPVTAASAAQMQVCG